MITGKAGLGDPVKSLSKDQAFPGGTFIFLSTLAVVKISACLLIELQFSQGNQFCPRQMPLLIFARLPNIQQAVFINPFIFYDLAHLVRRDRYYLLEKASQDHHASALSKMSVSGGCQISPTMSRMHNILTSQQNFSN